MRFIRPVAYTFLILMWMFIIGGTVIAGSTINSTSGNNTAIEGCCYLFTLPRRKSFPSNVYG